MLSAIKMCDCCCESTYDHMCGIEWGGLSEPVSKCARARVSEQASECMAVNCTSSSATGLMTPAFPCRHATFSLDDAEKQMGNPRVAFAANQARLKRFADQGQPQ